jgi:hypothetical protein
MANPCGYTAASFQDVADLLCTVQEDIKARVSTAQDAIITALNSGFAEVATDFGITDGKLDSIDAAIAWNGTTAGTVAAHFGDVIARLGTVQTSVDEVNEDTDLIIDSVGNRVGPMGTILQNTWRSATDQSVVDIAYATEQATQFGGNPLGALIGDITAAVFGGGTDIITLASTVEQIWNAPPLATLTLGSAAALAASNTIARASGSYGFVVELNIPGYWGRDEGEPANYVPAPARYQWRGFFGAIGPVGEIRSPVHMLYPIPVGADTLLISVLPGVVGQYQEMRFLGL